MSDLPEFLNARLDAAEDTARSAGESRIAWLTYRRDNGQMGYTTVADGHGGVWVADGKELPEPASVLVVYDTAQTLAEIEATRAAVKEHNPKAWTNWDQDRYCPACIEVTYDPHQPYERVVAPCKTLRLLALPYADHQDYRQEEWAP